MIQTKFPITLSLTLLAVMVCPVPAETVSFNREIRPILSDNCFGCHGFDPDTREADLRLDTREGATADNDGVIAIVQGDVGKSVLWKRIHWIHLKGETWNHKRVWRVYKSMKLNLPRRAKRRLPARSSNFEMSRWRGSLQIHPTSLNRR